jgi:hypothetical protein
MRLEILVAVLVVGGPLLALYVRELVKNLAREQTERALADYRHQQELTLAALNAAHQRGVAEFGLYTKKRHFVYGALYRRIRIAADAYSSFFGLSLGPDFSTYNADDIERYRKRNDLLPKDVKAATDAALSQSKKGVSDAMDELDHKVSVRKR